MIVGIDGSNIRSGGAMNYFGNMLAHASPHDVGVERVRVWGDRVTLDLLPDRSWIEPVHVPELERSQLYRLLWQRRGLPQLARDGCDLLFAPGGLVTGNFRPYVTMSRNMLPFEYGEMFRYGPSKVMLRLLLLRFGQGRSIRHADGIIFLTEYARQVVSAKAPPLGRVAVVPHGVDESFRVAPRQQEPPASFSEEHPFRILYVSILDVYKHQSPLAEAVALLRGEGLPVALDLVGPAYPPSERAVRATLARLDPQERFLHYRGRIPFDELPAVHRRANLFAFASSCENMPNILAEAMAGGHPIACARRGPMPEILGDAGVYFDPEVPADIADALRRMFRDPDLRERSARMAHERAAQYSWGRCAGETFEFIAQVARAHGIGSARPAAAAT
ncbi:MAG: glycosyltransferase family 4 protein [Myxococcota bacterium]